MLGLERYNFAGRRGYEKTIHNGVQKTHWIGDLKGNSVNMAILHCVNQTKINLWRWTLVEKYSNATKVLGLQRIVCLGITVDMRTTPGKWGSINQSQTDRGYMWNTILMQRDIPLLTSKLSCQDSRLWFTKSSEIQVLIWDQWIKNEEPSSDIVMDAFRISTNGLSRAEVFRRDYDKGELLNMCLLSRMR